MEVLDHGIQVKGLELLGIVECLTQGVGQRGVLVQDVNVQLIGPPGCVVLGRIGCVFASAGREGALGSVGPILLLAVVDGLPYCGGELLFLGHIFLLLRMSENGDEL
jgi:hypothetical protein